MHSTNNFSKYFTVAVNNTRSQNTNVAILNDIRDFTYHCIEHIKMRTSKGELRCMKQVYAHVPRKSVIVEDPWSQC
jgi:hypothetical protein